MASCCKLILNLFGGHCTHICTDFVTKFQMNVMNHGGLPLIKKERKGGKCLKEQTL